MNDKDCTFIRPSMTPGQQKKHEAKGESERLHDHLPGLSAFLTYREYAESITPPDSESKDCVGWHVDSVVLESADGEAGGAREMRWPLREALGGTVFSNTEMSLSEDLACQG
jgi:hypothetical protein